MFQASLVGPAIAPLIGGLATHYASWRMLQLVFCGLSASAFLLMYTQLPETSHPGTRGVDRALKAERVVAGVGDDDDYPQKWKWVWLNPFASLALLRAPNILAVVRTLPFSSANLSDLVYPGRGWIVRPPHGLYHVRPVNVHVRQAVPYQERGLRRAALPLPRARQHDRRTGGWPGI
jgi:MFS family permease